MLLLFFLFILAHVVPVVAHLVLVVVEPHVVVEEIVAMIAIALVMNPRVKIHVIRHVLVGLLADAHLLLVRPQAVNSYIYV